MKTATKTENVLMEASIKNDIKTLEKFYVNASLDNLPQIVEQEKQNVVEKITSFLEENTKILTDSHGNEITTIEGLTPYVVSNYFFRSINNLQNVEPIYSGEHLSILWNLYSYMVEQVNLNLCSFQPSISHFCKFIGITTSGLKKMLKSPDDGIRIAVEKIYDVCFDGHMTMSELGKYNARATTFRMKAEMNIVEKETPQVVINAQTIDFDSINKRIKELSSFNSKVKEADYEEK